MDKARSGYNKGTIRGDLRYLVVSKDVRRHRLISTDYITALPCHGRGREFESRRPRHSFQGVTGRDTGNSSPQLLVHGLIHPHHRQKFALRRPRFIGVMAVTSGWDDGLVS